MAAHDEPSAAQRAANVADSILESDLERVLKEVPRGTFALCGIAIALLVICWLSIYFGVFLPRGPVS